MKIKSERDKRNYIIVALCAILVVMGVGYAAFSQMLTINGTANISNSWCVGFDNTKTNAYVPKAGITGATAPTGSMSYSGSACESTLQPASSLTAHFYQPGDEIEYTLTIVNKSSVTAAIKSILVDNESVTSNTTKKKDNITYVVEMPESTTLAPNASTTMKVIAKFQNETDVTGNVNGETQSIEVKINAEQDDGNGGMVVERPLTPSDIKDKAGTSCDGELTEDSTEPGRYIYRGANPCNYITFNGETAGWRIVSIESDGTMKIVRNTSLGDMPWDAKGTRSSSTSTYCTKASNYECNAWAATSNLVGTPAEFTLYNPNGNSNTDTTTYSGTVAQDSSLNTFLNGEYYNNTSSNASYLRSDKGYIVAHNFYVGTPGNNKDEETIALDTQQEKNYVWNGNVGLIQATDYLKASTDTSCTSLKAAFNSPYPCGNGNYLKPSSGYYWTISPNVTSSRGSVWLVSGDGRLNYSIAYNSYGVRPAVYLSSNINLKGEGSSGTPYYID